MCFFCQKGHDEKHFISISSENFFDSINIYTSLGKREETCDRDKEGRIRETNGSQKWIEARHQEPIHFLSLPALFCIPALPLSL